MQNAAWQANAARASELLAAMANPKRLGILCLLADGERSVGEIADSLAARQSTVSQHLKVLKEAGIVLGEVDGEPCYCLDPNVMRWLAAFSVDLCCPADAACCE